MRGPKLSGSKILVVDGCRDSRAAVREFLRDIGVSVVEEAENGAEAIDKLGYFPADLVICDLNMAPIDDSVRIAYSTMAAEGGMRAPRVPPAATLPAARAAE